MNPSPPGWLLRLGRQIATASLALMAFVGSAQEIAPQTTTASPSLSTPLEAQVRQLALHNANLQAPGATRVEVSVGQLDTRLRLAPCAQVQPYLPPGVRLWGAARIGLRCESGASRWNVYLPIQVKFYGPGLVATSHVPAGSPLTAAHLTLAEIDLAATPSPAITDALMAIGRTLTRALTPGQSLRQSHLRPRQWFVAGDTVTVLAQGPGFSVAGEGQALSPGTEGQPVRVRTESGRVLTGQAVGEKRVEVMGP
jgi:flagellar basal body P-ring formation protein FlgA